MKTRGFTLLELLAVIIVLGVIALIVTPMIVKTVNDNKENLYQAQLGEIRTKTKDWMYQHLSSIPSVKNDVVTITLLDLKKSGLIGLDVRNPKTNELLPNDMEITIELVDNDYKITVLEESGTNITDTDISGPIMVLSGNSLEYLEMGSTYTDKGIKALDKDGNNIANIDIQYLENGVEVANISSNAFKTYTIVYTASLTSGGKTHTSHVVRTVIVRDTLAPVITVPATVTITQAEAQTYNIMTGVSATDNSNENITVTSSSFEKKIGDNVITYEASDSSGNKAIKRRLIKVTE